MGIRGEMARACALLLSACAGLVEGQYQINKLIPSKIPEDQFVRFVTRPDIHVPKWQVTVYDRGNVSPGYWFVAPYEEMGRMPPNPAWVGPQIFDGDGDLVWSAANTFESTEAFDFLAFPVNNGSSSRLSFISNYFEAGTILTESYEVAQRIPMGARGKAFNPHEFRLMENGTRALMMHRNTTEAPPAMVAEIGKTGKCRVNEHSFEEGDTTGGEWRTLFQWNFLDHLHLNESTMTDDACHGSWDYVHGNSVDKCPDGDYLFSARHTDAIYKISKDDGNVVWRLGGKKSDFKSDFKFSRQHDIRCHSQNATYTIVSMLDNAIGEDSAPATHEYSRGLLIALETAPGPGKPMRARILAQYPHPVKVHSIARGNCQILPNGNVWMGWADRSLQSEYTPDGRIVMEAVLRPIWLYNYRSYKSPFVGRPMQLPDVVANASRPAGTTGQAQTEVFVSWNGATEVAFWNLLRSDPYGDTTELITSSPRMGFETRLTYAGLASHVVVQALDAQGNALPNGRSVVVATDLAGNLGPDAKAADKAWLQAAKHAQAHPWLAALQAQSFAASAVSFLLGMVAIFAIPCGLCLGYKVLPRRFRAWRERTRYRPVGDGNGEGEGEEFVMDAFNHKLFDGEDDEEEEDGDGDEGKSEGAGRYAER